MLESAPGHPCQDWDRLPLLVAEFFIDAAEVLYLEGLRLAEAVGNDSHPVAPGAAPAHD